MCSGTKIPLRFFLGLVGALVRHTLRLKKATWSKKNPAAQRVKKAKKIQPRARIPGEVKSSKTKTLIFSHPCSASDQKKSISAPNLNRIGPVSGLRISRIVQDFYFSEGFPGRNSSIFPGDFPWCRRTISHGVACILHWFS